MDNFGAEEINGQAQMERISSCQQQRMSGSQQMGRVSSSQQGRMSSSQQQGRMSSSSRPSVELGSNFDMNRSTDSMASKRSKTQRGSMGSMDAEIQCRLKKRKSICRDCEPPKPYLAGDVRGGDCKDFQNQVEAGDILPNEAVQTGSSLHCRGPELPRRSTDRMRYKAGRKWWNFCDCECPRLRSRLDCLVDKRDVSFQADPRDIGSTESVQTGPSLIASGSFCRYDYSLRKPKYLREDCYASCQPSKAQAKIMPCNANRDACSNFHQQVVATDIKTTDEAQTGDSLRHKPRDMFDCKFGEKIMCARLPCPPYGYRRLYKSPHLHDCECPCAQDQSFRTAPKRNFATQVKSTNICPSRGAQTSPSLTGVTKKSRGYTNRAWECCTQPCPRLSKFQKAPYVKDIALQVCQLDISSCEAAQTGSSLSLNDAGPKYACTKPSTKRRFARYPVLYGMSKNFKTDDGECPRPQVDGRGSEQKSAGSQVETTDINPSSMSQTYSGNPVPPKCKRRSMN